jgi:hypothetical protein
MSKLDKLEKFIAATIKVLAVFCLICILVELGKEIGKNGKQINSIKQEQRELIDKAVKDLRDQLHHDKQVILELSRIIDDIEHVGAEVYIDEIICVTCHGGEE